MSPGPSPAAADASPSVDDWARPSRRARVIALALAVAIAMVIFLIVNRFWHGAAPPALPAKPPSVEVQLVRSPSKAPLPTTTSSPRH